MIRLCVLGPSGRMGRMVIEQALAHPEITVTGAVDRPGSELAGTEVCPGVVATEDLEAGLAGADVYIDFTTPAGTAAAARAAAEREVAGIIGTTGLDAAAEAAVDALARVAPVVWAPNFSLGVNLLLGLAERAARALGPAFDLEVVEIHHRHKRDAPSGTAIALADALARGRAANPGPGSEARAEAEAEAENDRQLTRRHGRDGDIGPRPAGEIGVLAVRGGDVVGEHTAYLLGPQERIEITHRAGSRAIFAAGALRAACWAAGKPAGRYQMRDVLGL